MEMTSSPSAYASVSTRASGSSEEGSFGSGSEGSASRCLRSREAISLLEEEEDGFFLFLSNSVEMSTSHSSRECHSSSRGCRDTDGRCCDTFWMSPIAVTFRKFHRPGPAEGAGVCCSWASSMGAGGGGEPLPFETHAAPAAFIFGILNKVSSTPLSESCMSISQRKRSQAIHPIGGVLTNPLSMAKVIPGHEDHLPAIAAAAPTDTPAAPTTPSNAPASPPPPSTGAKNSTPASKPPATNAAPTMTFTSPAARLTSGPPTAAPKPNSHNFAAKKVAFKASREDWWYIRALMSSLDCFFPAACIFMPSCIVLCAISASSFCIFLLSISSLCLCSVAHVVVLSIPLAPPPFSSVRILCSICRAFLCLCCNSVTSVCFLSLSQSLDPRVQQASPCFHRSLNAKCRGSLSTVNMLSAKRRPNIP
ncbi:hypothetical protein EYF80_012507 [Liparis tanakae]|uniref:Uncharacterized protein n=1 Tax=Liparis tanakae TaxID=230148 RepID=A0A4Z2IGX0_9TELE|nr:hypothetical protein EYF80_012507 [Liparis tanakae]